MTLDAELRMYPILADHVRLQPLRNVVRVFNVRTGEVRHLSPSEALPLEMARGAHSLEEIAMVIAGVCRLDETLSAAAAMTALDAFAASVQWSPVPVPPLVESNPIRLYTVESTCEVVPGGRQPRPSELVCSLSTRCNFGCVHCCAGAGSPLSGELLPEEWLRIIDEAGGLGMQSVLFSGGEPTLQPALPEYVAAATRHGLYPILSTNASRVTDVLAARLADAGLRFAHVSLCSAEPSTFDLLTRTHGELTAVARGVRNLKRRQIYVRVKHVMMPQTLELLWEIFEWARELKVDELHLAPYRLTHRAPIGVAGVLRPDDFVVVEDSVARWRRLRGHELRICTPWHERLHWTVPREAVRCGGVKTRLVVLANGDVAACELLQEGGPFKLGNVRESGLMAIWRSDGPERLQTAAVEQALEPCRTCEWLKGCRTGCFSLSLAVGGGAFGPDPRCWKANYDKNPFIDR